MADAVLGAVTERLIRDRRLRARPGVERPPMASLEARA
jgi:hypothetical protein